MARVQWATDCRGVASAISLTEAIEAAWGSSEDHRHSAPPQPLEAGVLPVSCSSSNHRTCR
jgi:hypothetical protein